VRNRIKSPEKTKFVLHYLKRKIIKKGWKIALLVLFIILSLLGGVWLALQNSKVQTYITQRLANHLSEKAGSIITIGRVDIAFFNRIILEDVLVEDTWKDTLLFVNKVSANIDSFKIRKRRIALSSLKLDGSYLQITRDTAGAYNFDFLTDLLKKPQKSRNEWQYSCNQFDFLDATFIYNNQLEEEDPKSIRVEDFRFNISDLAYAGDSLHFNINRLSLNDGKDFMISNLSSNFIVSGKVIKLNGFNVKTNYSEISDSRFYIELPEEKEDFLESVQFDFQFSPSKISFYDISLLVPQLAGMEQVVDLSGQIHGNLNNLKGKELKLSTGEKTEAVLDFYVNDITSTETMYLFLDLKESKTTFKELSRIKLPGNGSVRYLQFPDVLYQAGQVTYKGNFTGFLTDFVAFGTLNSRLGRITTDLSVVPDAGKRVTYRGKVATRNFKLGDLIKTEHVGTITANGSVDGYFIPESQSVAGRFEGGISQVEINNYNYENIRLDGMLNNRMFDGFVAMNDSNLQFDFLGKVNLNPDVPVFDFRLDLKKALPGNLNLSTNYPNSELAFLVNANFSGNQIDNLTGSIDVESGKYANRNGEFDLGGIKLQSISNGINNYLSFSSEYFDIDINGDYHLQNLIDAFEKSMYRYLPVVNYDPDNQEKLNKFGYQVDVKNLDALTAVFIPDIKIETPFLLYGQMDSEHSVFELKGSIPGFQTKNLMIRNIFIGNNPKDSVFASRFRFGEVLFKNGMKLENLTVDSEISNNTITNQIAWGQEGKKKYSGEILTKVILSDTKDSPYSHFEITGFPSQIFIADSLWQIDPFTATIDSSTIRIGNFSIQSGNQVISVDGEVAENDTSMMSIMIENLDLARLGKYAEKDLPMEGNLNGMAAIQDYYGQRLIFSDLKIRKFLFRDQEIGNLALLNQWDNDRSLLQSALEISTQQGQKLLVEGNYIPKTKELLYFAYFDELSLVALETFIRSNISDFKGHGTGKIKIHGTTDKILLDGVLAGKNAGLTVDYTKVSYTFTDSIYFKGDTILFDQIPFRDPMGNRGVFNGTLVHKNFLDMQYNLSVNSQRLQALNTSASDNSQFFGQVMANGRFEITGRGRNVNLSGSATTLLGTDVKISLEDESVLERYDFIQFISTENTDRQDFLLSRRDDGDFSLNLTIRATPEARAQLIYNSQIGDVIKAQGSGLLRFGMDKEGNITLSGDYTVERGDYLFTLQNVINKRFTIERGGTIQWSGSPYNALINISAVYRVKASLYDLFVDSYNNVYQNQRIQVESKILLTDELSNPNINFAINFPTVEDRLVEELKQYFSTQEELNKQILSLVVLGKFYTPEYIRGTYEAQNPNLIGTTASELFSNQLSNWLSQISNNVDIGLNYRPGNQLTNDEIELAMSTQIFNDRVTLNGNIGNNNNPNTTTNSQLVGDFDVNVKLIPSGKLQLKAYNRSNNNLIYETAPYTQGVGFSFTEEFNSLNHLFEKMKAIFARKKKVIEQEEEKTSTALSSEKKN